MENQTHEMQSKDIENETYLTNNWLTSEVLIGMYSRVFTNLLLCDDKIFKSHSK